MTGGCMLGRALQPPAGGFCKRAAQGLDRRQIVVWLERRLKRYIGYKPQITGDWFSHKRLFVRRQVESPVPDTTSPFKGSSPAALACAPNCFRNPQTPP